MDEQFKEEWIAALRSGEYKQTTGALTRVDHDGTLSHCCLGVACEIAVKKGILVYSVSRDEPMFSGTLKGYRSEDKDELASFSTLPFSLLDAVGINDIHGIVGIPARAGNDTDGITAPASLPTINDSGESFEHIADLIEHFG